MPRQADCQGPNLVCHGRVGRARRASFQLVPHGRHGRGTRGSRVALPPPASTITSTRPTPRDTSHASDSRKTPRRRAGRDRRRVGHATSATRTPAGRMPRRVEPFARRPRRTGRPGLRRGRQPDDPDQHVRRQPLRARAAQPRGPRGRGQSGGRGNLAAARPAIGPRSSPRWAPAA